MQHDYRINNQTMGVPQRGNYVDTKSIGKRCGVVRPFGTFMMISKFIFEGYYEVYFQHFAPTLRYAHDLVSYSVDMLYVENFIFGFLCT